MPIARSSSKVIDTNLSSAGAGAYTAGDIVDSVKTLSGVAMDNRMCVRLDSLVVIDTVAQSAALDILFFTRSITVGADNAANAISEADLRYCVGRYSIVGGDYVTTTAGRSEATVRGLGLLMQCEAGSKDLFMVVIARGTPTYGVKASAVVVKAGFLRD
jgi:hypothetical protein